MTNETIYKTYAKEICKNCKNKKDCQEELKRKLDNTIRCERYERKK